MAIDTLSMILLVVGAIIVILAFLNAFAKASKIAGVIGAVVLVFGALGAMGVVDFAKVGGGQSPQPFTETYQPSQNQPSQSSSLCSANAATSNGKSQADILYQNAENSTGIGYLTGSVSANSNGAVIDTATTNAGGSGTSYVSMSSIPNCGKGQLVATVTTGAGFASSQKVRDVELGVDVSGYNFNDKSVHKYVIRGASSNVIQVLARDTSYKASSNGQANGSVNTALSETDSSPESPDIISGTGTADGSAYFQNTTLGAKGSINFYMDLKVNGTSSVAGAYGEPDGVIISYDSGTAAVFSSNAMDLQSDTVGWALTRLSSCPVDIQSNRNVEACWSAPSMISGKLYRVKGTLVADNGDPLATTTAASPSLWFDDKVFFRDTDGNVKYQSFSSSGGTNQGTGGTQLVFVVN